MKFNLLKELINEGPVSIRVTGDCMRGSIAAGSQVQLSGRRSFRPGDMITFRRSNGELVTHRFLGYLFGRSGWLALTRADSEKSADSPVSLADVLGKVSHVGGKPYQPGLHTRYRALAGWVASIPGLVIRRFRHPSVNVENG